MDLRCFQLHRSYLIPFKFSNVGEIFWVETKRTVRKFRKRKRKFLCCAHYSIKRVHEVSCHSHATMPGQEMHVQSCFLFANLNLLLFCCSPSPLQKLPVVVIQKFCYHGNMTSHFSLYCSHNYYVHKHLLISFVQHWTRGEGKKEKKSLKVAAFQHFWRWL